MEFPNYPISAMTVDPEVLTGDDPLNTDFKLDENGIQIKEEPCDYESMVTEDYKPFAVLHEFTDNFDNYDNHYNDEDDEDNKMNIVKIKSEPTTNGTSSSKSKKSKLKEKLKLKKVKKEKKDNKFERPTVVKVAEFTQFPNDPLDRYHSLKKKKFKCDMCGIRLAKIEHYNQHIQEHYEITPYKCDTCDKRFKLQSLKSSHEKLHLRESRKCTICDKICYTERDYKIHMDQHNPNNDPYKCGFCHIMYADADSLLSHMNQHCGTRMHCNLCEKRFFDINALDLHIKIHQGAKPFECDQCDKSFKYESLLYFHKVTHVDFRKRKYHCEFCDKSFKAEAQIRAHTRISHRRVKTYRCENCGESASTISELRSHRNKAHKLKEEKPYKCGECMEAFSIFNEYEIHMTMHENPIYQCNGCDKEFQTVQLLCQHIRGQTGDKPYKCEMCSRAFTQLNQLGYHMHTKHNEERPYTCEICKKTYVAFASFKNHMDGHVGKIKKRPCKICGKKLTHVESHMKTKHNIIKKKKSKKQKEKKQKEREKKKEIENEKEKEIENDKEKEKKKEIENEKDNKT